MNVLANDSKLEVDAMQSRDGVATVLLVDFVTGRREGELALLLSVVKKLARSSEILNGC